ncbi:hypothetical protein GS4_02_02360 [Gordonia soli NBRC 108243]|uniref:Uncharacterized protein n=1 Tax=Gordonia soli NBRC 108243 TaxID=1223545 RepID=M0QD75_9ACTN|nr:hypothetical protein GS4_02_02360 [Gordonia soli NBRC 108243]
MDRDVARPIPRPSLEPSSCRWSSTLVVLDSDGPERGACANRSPVLYRSAIVEYGNTITVSRFSCLSESVGLYCIESGSRSGFAITPTGYRVIDAEDRAPTSLLGGATGDSTDDPMNRSDEPSDTDSDSVPTS